MKKLSKTLQIWLYSISTLVVLVAAIGVYEYVQFFGQKTEKEVMVYVYPDMTRDALVDSLAVYFGEDMAGKFETLCQFEDINPKSRRGAYKVKAGTSPFYLWRKLTRGSQSPINFTFNNKRMLKNFAEGVGETMMISADSIYSYISNPEVYKELGFTKETFPAMFIPDTYELYWTSSAKTIVKKMHEGYEAFWNESRRKQAKALGLTPVQVSTLASIVEEETAQNAEKPIVAGLYLNRLRIGMKLQADPTVKFAVGDTQLRRILNRHLTTDSPYNTYLYAGLPPGPIRLSDKSSLLAVLNAKKHNYLYMCAKEDFSGTHRFTASLSEHNYNARLYQAALNKRGIKK